MESTGDKGMDGSLVVVKGRGRGQMNKSIQGTASLGRPKQRSVARLPVLRSGQEISGGQEGVVRACSLGGRVPLSQM